MQDQYITGQYREEQQLSVILQQTQYHIIFGNVGGTILVRETNIAGCVTNHNPFAVSVNPLPTANISNGGNMCDGGTRPLSVAFTGTAPFNFTYAINGVPQTPIATSSNPYIINATLAGTYTIVNITDNTGCTNTGSGSTTITYFPKPTGIISGGGELCRGSSATLTLAFTGVAPFTFTYTDGTTPVTVTGHPNNVYTASVSPLVNSTYTLTSLTDFNNCTGVLSGSAVITVNQPPSLSLTGTNLICYNVATGAVDMTISAGTAPFRYRMDRSQRIYFANRRYFRTQRRLLCCNRYRFKRMYRYGKYYPYTASGS